MSARAARVALAAGALALGAACVPKQGGFDEVQAAALARTGHRIFWNQGGEADAEVHAKVAAMLAHPVSQAEAVQIALLQNHRLQATYEELAIAQADVVQAGLLRNPVFAADLRAPVQGTSSPVDYDLHVEEDFLSVLLIPARKRVAEAEFRAAKLRVASEVVALAHDVRAAYIRLQAEEQLLAIQRVVFNAAEASAESARRQLEAGNISELELANEESAFAQARVDLAHVQAGALETREKLARLMGVWGPDAAYRITAGLPDLPRTDPPLEHLESAAIAQRLDLAAAREDLQARAHATAMAKNWRWIGGATVGAHYERETDGRFVGPTGSLEVPLFDQKQAAIARLEADERRARERLEGLATEVRSEVREARARLVLARSLVEQYRTAIVPLRERLVALTQVQYNAMLMGVYQLLAAKQAEAAAYREAIEALRDYWIARIDLDVAAGGRLASGPR